MTLVALAVWMALQGSGGTCQASGGLRSLAGLSEASGLAVSRATPGWLWSHNDSGAPVLVAFDADGRIASRVTISGARVEDWEALTSGRCPSGTCLYIGDIGDNDGTRAQITIYRIAEPMSPGGTAQAESFHAAYPDGAHDAESLLIAPDGTIVVITKGDTGPVAVYKFPRELRSGAVMKLERVGQPLFVKPTPRQRVTDAAISADGKRIALRTNGGVTFYDADLFLRGEYRATGTVDLAGLREPQGEGIAFGAGSTIFVAGEGGGKNLPGTLGTLTCKF